MTGPEHYREAERLLQHSKEHTDSGDLRDDAIAAHAARQAQVHATLALAAATVAVATGPLTAVNSAARIAWEAVVRS